MNIAAQMKYETQIYSNARKKSNYVVNVSFDIPIEPDKFVISEPLSGQFTITPAHPKKNLKLKLGSARTTQQAQSRKLSCATDTLCVNSSRNHKKNQTLAINKLSLNTTRHCKNLSYSHSKSPTKISHKVQRSVSSYNNQYAIKAFHKKIACEIDDEIIGYTNPSTQFKMQQQDARTARTQKNSVSKQFQSKRSPIMTPIIKKYEKIQTEEIQLLNEIKKFEKNSKEKKENLNLLYMKQKILMQSCARKIQRAWRNYRTRKLINAYSSTASLKLTNKAKNLFNERQQFIYQPKKILNVKSCGYKNGKNQMKKSIKQSKEYFIDQIKEKQRADQNLCNQELMKKMQYQKKIQIQQIQKWESLIKDLRKTKSIEQALDKTRQHKNQLLRRNQGEWRRKQQKQSLDNQQLKKTINKIQNQQSKSQIEKSLNDYEKKVSRKLQKQKQVYSFFQHQDSSKKSKNVNIQDGFNSQIQKIRQIKMQENQNQTQSKIQETLISKELEKQFLKNQKIDNNQSQGFFERRQKQQQIQNKQQNDNEEISAEKKLLKNFENLIKQYQQNDRNFLKQNGQNIQKNLSDKQIDQNKELKIKIISDEVFVKQFNEAVEQVTFILLQNKLSFKKPNQNLSLSRQQKAEGICTNMQSIKDYLQNLISYIFDQCPERIIQGFNTPIGPSSEELLQMLRKIDWMPHDNANELRQEEVMGKNLFTKHWTYASQQIYFQNKYSDPKRQKQRIDRLKQITKVYFQVIFDSFNQCLSPYRVYGLKGEPFLWEKSIKNQRCMSNINSLKPYIKHAYKDLAQLSVIFCGLSVQNKRPRLPQQMIQQIQEQRMHIFLQHDMKTSEHTWNDDSLYRAQIMLHLSLYIAQKEMNEFTWQLMELLKKTQAGTA